MIVDAMAALITAIETVTELTGSTGTSVASTYPDVGAVTIPLPAACPFFVGRVPMDRAQNGFAPRQVTTKELYSVVVYLDNSQGQHNLITVQLPILDKVVAAVRGADVVQGGFRFAFEGEKLHSITPARIAYEQRYSIVSSH